MPKIGALILVVCLALATGGAPGAPKPRPPSPSPPALVVLNATTRSAMTKHIRGELEAAGAPVARTEVANRAAFAAAAINGSAPCWMGAPARAAAANIAALTDEILEKLRR
jgi:hypothetical protein